MKTLCLPAHYAGRFFVRLWLLCTQKTLVEATSAVINGARFTLTSIGAIFTVVLTLNIRLNGLTGYDEIPAVFSRVTHRLQQMPRVFILVAWSSYHCEAFQLLHASLACNGRSLPLMSRVVAEPRQGSPDVHEQLLTSLSRCLNPVTEVTIIADAGFYRRGSGQIS